MCVRVSRTQEVAHEWPHVSAPRRPGSVLQLQLTFVPDTVPLSVSLALFLSLSVCPWGFKQGCLIQSDISHGPLMGLLV